MLCICRNGKYTALKAEPSVIYERQSLETNSFTWLASLLSNCRPHGVANGCGVRGGGDAGDDDHGVYVPEKSPACVLLPFSQRNFPGSLHPVRRGGHDLSYVLRDNLRYPRPESCPARGRRPPGHRLSWTGAAFHSVSGEDAGHLKRIQQAG